MVVVGLTNAAPARIERLVVERKRCASTDDDDWREHCVPLEVEVETDCSSELAPRVERWLAMERASQQGRAKGFIGPDDLARSLTNRRRFRGEQIYIIDILDSCRGHAAAL